ncbi:hypothetical protein HYS48_04325 [Candidatus Woesearchaeota archaeon]|nr:hypothetical protein [Candidatus Woesearchaeota archaeon]
MKELEQWMEKMKGKEFDLSKDEDLSIALMNLISLEEHLYFSAMKTGNKQYFPMLQAVRQLRIKLLKRIVKNPKGEEWCISKHLLAASMRLMEVGTKELSEGKEDALSLFQSSFHLYSLFFAINLGMVEIEKVKEDVGKSEEASKGMMQKISVIVKKIIDCCKE